MILQDKSFKILDESAVFILGYVFEDAYIINRINKIEYHVGDFYGDPTYGIISSNNDWCLIGGEHLALWYPDESTVTIENKDIGWIINAKQTEPFGVKLMVENHMDPVSIWWLNVLTLERYKIKELPDYQPGLPGDIDWYK